MTATHWLAVLIGGCPAGGHDWPPSFLLCPASHRQARLVDRAEAENKVVAAREERSREVSEIGEGGLEVQTRSYEMRKHGI